MIIITAVPDDRHKLYNYEQEKIRKINTHWSDWTNRNSLLFGGRYKKKEFFIR